MKLSNRRPRPQQPRLLFVDEDQAELWNRMSPEQQQRCRNLLSQLLQQIVPEVGELHLPLIGNQIRITFHDPSTPTRALNPKSLGTGVEQLLMTLVVGLMGDGPSGALAAAPIPVPEPANWLLLALGLIVLAGRALMRRGTLLR